MRLPVKSINGTPTSSLLLVDRDFRPTQTEGGIYLPDGAKETTNVGVVRVSSGVSEFSEGERVVFSERNLQELDGGLLLDDSCVYCAVDDKEFTLAGKDRVIVRLKQKGRESGAILLTGNYVSNQSSIGRQVYDVCEVLVSTHPDIEAGMTVGTYPKRGIKMFHSDFPAIIPEGEEWRVYKDDVDDSMFLIE